MYIYWYIHKHIFFSGRINKTLLIGEMRKILHLIFFLLFEFSNYMLKIIPRRISKWQGCEEFSLFFLNI